MNRLIGRMKQLARRMARQGRLLSLAALCLLVLATPAQADFRKALEAYQNRDGDKLLAEVRDAVEKGWAYSAIRVLIWLFAIGFSLIFVTQTAYSEILETSQKNQNQESNTDFYAELKQEIKIAETSADRDPHKFAYLACYKLKKKANGDINQLKQAYLWCAVGDKEKGIMTTPNPSEDGFALYKMHKSGELKQIDHKLDAVWEDRKKLIKHLSEIELPDLLLEVRKELANTNMPVFTAYFTDDYFGENSLIEVFEDGRIRLVINETYVKQQLTTSTQTVKNFMSDLKKLGFYNWGQPNDWFETSMCEYNCYSSSLRVTTREGANVNRIFFRAMYESFNDRPDKIKSEYYLPRHENLMRMAKIKALILKHFSFDKFFRCSLDTNNKQRMDACIQREIAWQNLAKEEK